MPTTSRALTPVIGLEIHARMMTRTKAFCACRAASDAPPNTLTCPVCLGLPGALPVLNGEFVRRTVTLGLALGCTVRPVSRFARKHYFYPDLPKGYQITQYEDPVCHNGLFAIVDAEGQSRDIRITRVHMEEDAGRLVHGAGDRTLVDFNRCGLPLAEIVTGPDLRSPSEASAFFRELRRLLVHLDLCDGNMEDGSLRCDANISLQDAGSDIPGVRTEVKNLNSFHHLEQALAYEIRRQTELLREGGTVLRETLLWDEKLHRTVPMRGKEESADYRYFPEPDLLPVAIEQRMLDDIRSVMPELPAARRERFMREYSLQCYDVDVLLSEKRVADYFESVVALLRERSPSRFKAACNMITTVLLGILHGHDIRQRGIPVPVSALARIIDHIAQGLLTHTEARGILRRAVREGIPIEPLIDRAAGDALPDESALVSLIDSTIEQEPDAVAKHLAGKRGAFEYLVGRIMRATGDKADPRRVRELLEQRVRVTRG